MPSFRVIRVFRGYIRLMAIAAIVPVPRIKTVFAVNSPNLCYDLNSSQLHVPHFGPSRCTFRARDVEDDHVVARFGVAMRWVLLVRCLAITEIPLPLSDSPDGQIFEADQAAVHIDDLPAPPCFEFSLQRRFNGHQLERTQL